MLDLGNLWDRSEGLQHGNVSMGVERLARVALISTAGAANAPRMGMMRIEIHPVSFLQVNNYSMADQSSKQ